MRKRMDMAKNKGCDGIEPDNVDAYSNHNTGFHFTAADQLAYNKWLATGTVGLDESTVLPITFEKEVMRTLMRWHNRKSHVTEKKKSDENAHTWQKHMPFARPAPIVVRCLDSIIHILATYKMSRLASSSGWAGQFESDLVANPRWQVFSWRGSIILRISEIYTTNPGMTVWCVRE